MHSRFLPTGVLLALLFGCGPKTPPPGTSGSAPAGHAVSAAAGGVVGDASGAQITVPPGALPKDARIQLAQKGDTHASPGVRVVGPVWSFQVDGADHFTFTKPVTVAVPVDPALRKPGSSVGLSVWSGERWQAVPGARLDPASSKVVAEVGHFSEYAPTQESPFDRLREDVLLNNEYWYGRILVSIEGTGESHGDLGEVEGLTVSREAELTFRLRANPGELGMVSALEELKKRPGVVLPPQAAKGMERVKELRHWTTELVKPQPEDRTDVHIRVKDSRSFSAPKVELGELREEAGAWQQTLDGDWTESIKIAHSLEIDAKKGTYSFSLGDFSGGELKYHRSVTGQPPQDSQKPMGLSFLIKNQKLPDLSGVLDGFYPIPSHLLDFTFKGVQGGWDLKGAQVRGRVSWTFSPVPLDDVELVLALDGYDDWLPRGGPSDQAPGNELPVHARLRKRGGGATKARMKSLTIRLKEASREPGICLNQPLQDPSDSFDLRFPEGSGYTVEEKGTHVVKKGSEFDHLDVKLGCYDWGAWGTLVGEALLADGRFVFATLDKDPSVEEILIPKRKANSKIADKWKKEMNAEGLPDKDDQDPQQGNKNAGDGLTLYEEYRGLIAQGKHTRDHPAGADHVKPLTPLHKDLIVVNKIGNQPFVRKGIELFEQASGIHIVELRKDELPDSRVVNVNRGTLSAGAQCGLVLVNEKGKTVGAGGETQGKTQKIGDPFIMNSPKGFEKIVVDVDYLTSVYKASPPETRKLYTLDDQLSSTIAHELAHGLGLSEHGTFYATTLNPIQAKSSLRIFDSFGEEIKERPFTCKGDVGEPGSEASGDVNCIMRYNQYYQWAYHRGDGVYAHPPSPPGRIFCTSPKGTGFNAPHPNASGEVLPGIFGDAIPGNCLGHMKVKDQ